MHDYSTLDLSIGHTSVNSAAIFKNQLVLKYSVSTIVINMIRGKLTEIFRRRSKRSRNGRKQLDPRCICTVVQHFSSSGRSVSDRDMEQLI